MLLTWIAEIADEPLVLEPADRQVECETNTWRLGAGPDDRGSLSVPQVVAALERTATALRDRIRDLEYSGDATFYVWHDVQAGALCCSTGSVPPDDLPFGGEYVPSGDPGPVVEGFLADDEPGVVGWAGLEPCGEEPERTGEDPGPAPFQVWVTDVGTLGSYREAGDHR
ncbi:hypothetical protein [Streptomyces fructofermentans]|uniref:Uncharacterized protein n=1 Tax=Streptomyces fructofermentans TaxID=152141 RepID=A0A918KHE8_9ACTN|nr:hypothetical protein [Streptomyces fructofermentans]GGX63910.1 hypothetical protein GCM10010515_34540 [Streptomyces fructofermentans]